MQVSGAQWRNAFITANPILVESTQRGSQAPADK